MSFHWSPQYLLKYWFVYAHSYTLKIHHSWVGNMKIIFHLPCISYFLVSMRKDLHLIRPLLPHSPLLSWPASGPCSKTLRPVSRSEWIQSLVVFLMCPLNHSINFLPRATSQRLRKSERKTWHRNLWWSWNSLQEFLDFWVGCFILGKTLSLLKVETNSSSGFKLRFF